MQVETGSGILEGGIFPYEYTLSKEGNSGTFEVTIKDVAERSYGTIFSSDGIVIGDHIWEIAIDIEEPSPSCCCKALERFGACFLAFGESVSRNDGASTQRSGSECVYCMICLYCLPLAIYNCCWQNESCLSVKLRLLSDGQPKVRCVATFFHNKYGCFNLKRGKKKNLSRYEELKIRHLANHPFGRTSLSSLIKQKSLAIKLQITIPNQRTWTPHAELEMTKSNPVNVYIITDRDIREHVAQTVCFGIAPIHHKVAFLLTVIETVGDFLQKVRQENQKDSMEMRMWHCIQTKDGMKVGKMLEPGCVGERLGDYTPDDENLNGEAPAPRLTFYLEDVSESKSDLQEWTATTILVFFKYFDISQTEMSYAGSTYFQPGDSCRRLFEAATKMKIHPESSPSFTLLLETGPLSLQPISGQETVESAGMNSGSVLVICPMDPSGTKSLETIKHELEKLYSDNMPSVYREPSYNPAVPPLDIAGLSVSG